VNKRYAVAIVTGTWLACSAAAGAQTAGAQAAAPQDQPHVISSQDLQLLRQDIRSQKKQLIAQNLKLTDAEATRFWPIYDQYTAELVKINDKKYGAIQQYADHFGTLTDDQALSLSRQLLEVDVSAAQLREKYLPTVAKAIGGIKAATFSQLDRRISQMIDLQLASKVPLAQSQNH